MFLNLTGSVSRDFNICYFHQLILFDKWAQTPEVPIICRLRHELRDKGYRYLVLVYCNILEKIFDKNCEKTPCKCRAGSGKISVPT